MSQNVILHFLFITLPVTQTVIQTQSGQVSGDEGTLSLSPSPSPSFTTLLLYLHANCQHHRPRPVLHHKYGFIVVILPQHVVHSHRPFFFQDHQLNINNHKIQANYVNINIREINSDISATTTTRTYPTKKRTSSDEPSTSLPEREREISKKPSREI